MSRVLTNENNYYDIADTIRQMKNVNTTYKPREMASALKDIYSNEVEGVPPLSFEANGNNLLNYRIDGNTGGVGDRTSNLFDYSTVTRGYRIMWASGTSVADNSAIMSDFIAVSNGIYRASASFNLIGYDINKNYIGTYDPYSKMFKKDYSSKTNYYDIANNNVKFVKLLSYSATDTISQDTMFCNSTTIPEYEPYGYKVPVVISGKNLLQNTASSQTINDVTFTVNNDGSIICNGTSSAVTTFAISIKLNSNINYVLSGSPKNGGAETYRLDLRNISYSVYNNTVDNGNGINFAVEENGTYLVCIRIATNYTCNNLTFYPMIRLASIQDDTYEPYIEPTTTNIYLDEPIEANESISLSETNVDIPTIEGTNVITIDTTVQPSNVYIQAPKDSLEATQIANELEAI